MNTADIFGSLVAMAIVSAFIAAVIWFIFSVPFGTTFWIMMAFYCAVFALIQFFNR